MPETYHYWLVAVSVLIALVAAYAAFEMASRIISARPGVARGWLVLGAIAVGIGFWAVQFVGLLADGMPVPASYDRSFAVLSVVMAVAVSWISLRLLGVGRGKASVSRLLAGAAFIGSGLSLVELFDMDAIRLPLHYEPERLALCAATAVGLSFAALLAAFSPEGRGDDGEIKRPYKLVASVLLGGAASLLHYANMGAVTVGPAAESLPMPAEMNRADLASLVAGPVFLLLLFVLMYSVANPARSFWRMLMLISGAEASIHAIVSALPEDAPPFLANLLDPLLLTLFLVPVIWRIKTDNQALLLEKDRVKTTLESISDGVIAVDAAGTVEYMNPSAEALTGWRAGAGVGMPLDAVFRVSKPAEGSAADGVPAGDGGTASYPVLQQRGGAPLTIEVSMAVLHDPKLPENRGKVLAFRDIGPRERARQALLTSYENQRLLNALLRISSRELSLDELLEQALAIILTANWLPPDGQAGIFLVDHDGKLVLRAQRNMSDAKLENCGAEPFGDGLCERTAGVRQIEFTPCFKSDRQFADEGLADHAHYHVCLQQDGPAVGVMVLSVAREHCPNEREIGFLEAVGKTLSYLIEQKRADERQLLSAKVFDNSLEGIIITNLDAEILQINQAFCDITGYAPEEMVGQTLFTPRSPIHGEGFYEGIWSWLHAYGWWQGEIWSQRRNGEDFPAWMRVSAIRDGQGQIVNYIGIFSDLSEQKRSEEALREARDELETRVLERTAELEQANRALQGEIAERQRVEAALNEADRRKNVFLAMLAHELRNPLAPIHNAVEIWRRSGISDPQVQWAGNVIDRQIGHLTHLVDDLLDVARITQGKISLDRVPLDLAMVVDRAVEVVQPLIDSRRQALTVALPAKQVRLYGDLTRLAQVVSNLLNNAAKYTEEGGKIQLSAEVSGAEVVLRVRDTGMGIAAEVLPHVFHLFSQADQTLDHSQGGLGIGLTLVQKLAELHGGQVQAFSAGPGQGSEFAVHLPLLTAESPAEEPPPAAQPSAAKASGFRVLVVDDNKDAATTLALLLGLHDHQVHLAHDGPTALRAAADFRPHIAFLDIGLPGMDGYELASRLRQQAETKDTMLVAVTGYGHREDRQRALSSGFDHHLVKPAKLEVLDRLFVSLEGAAR